MKIEFSKIADAKKIYSLMKKEKKSAYTIELVKDLIETKKAVSIKLVSEGKIIGALGARPEGKNAYWLYYVIVDKKHRNNGYARALVDSFYSLAKRNGAKRVATDTPEKEFFEKVGLKEVGRIPRWYEDKDQIIMHKKL